MPPYGTPLDAMNIFIGTIILILAAKLGFDALVALVTGNYDTERYSWLTMIGVVSLAIFTAGIGLAVIGG